MSGNSILIGIGVHDDGVQVGLNIIKGTIDTFVSAVKKSFDALADSVAQSMTDMFKEGNIAAGLGLLVNQFQELKYAARLSGLEVEGLNRVLINLNRSIGSAVDGNKQKNAVFAAMGLDPEALATKSPKDALMDIARAISAIGNTAQRASVAGTIFTAKGQQLGQLLVFLKAMADEGERMNAVFKNITTPWGQEQQAQINAYNKNLIAMDTIWQSISRTIGARVATPIGRIFEQIMGIKNVGNTLDTIIDAIATRLEDSFVVLVAIGAMIKNVFVDVIAKVSHLLDTIKPLLKIANGDIIGGGKDLLNVVAHPPQTDMKAGVYDALAWARGLFKKFPTKDEQKTPFINDEFIKQEKIKTVPLGFAQNLSSFAGSGAGQIEALKAASQKIQQVEDLGVTKELVGISKKLDSVGRVK